MNLRKMHIVSTLLIAVSAIATAALYERLPAELWMHWNFQGVPDDTMPKLLGTWLLLALAIGIYALFQLLPQFDPLRKNVDRFRSVYNMFALAMVVFMVGLHWFVILWNLGWQFAVGRVVVAGIGGLFAFIGWLLPRTRRNWFLGIRTPWTMSSDRIWEQTHWLGGWLFLAVGVLLVLLSIFQTPHIVWIVGGIVIAALVPVVYSFVLFMKGEG